MLDKLVKSLDIISLIIVVVFFLLLGYRPPWWAKKHVIAKKSIWNIPGPLSLPILGTRWIYSSLGGYSFNRIHEFYAAALKKYGPILKEETLWNVPIISIVDRADIEKVLKFNSKFPLRPPTEIISLYRKSRPDRYATVGLINEQGPTWQHLRNALTTQLTSPRTIFNFLPQLEEISADWCNLIRLNRDENNFVSNIKELTVRLGLETICALVLGRRMGFLLPEGMSVKAKRLADAVHEHFLATRDAYYGLPFWKLFRTSSYNRFCNSEDEIYNLVLELVDCADECAQESVVFQSIINASLDPREKTAAIVDFIAAGIHTLSNSLVYLIYLIGRHSEVQNRLLLEIKDETSNHNYLKACVNEAYRLLPTANCLARITEEEYELAGHRIKPGNVILCHIGLACRDNNNFYEAAEFRPDRWLGAERASTISAATYLVVPFGVGRRACPGRRFIDSALPILLSTIVREFVFTSTETLQLEFEFLLVPKDPIPMIFHNRL